jgi:hypothetical protein
MKATRLAALAALLLANPAAADTWFVNNATGDDTKDGRSAKTAFATIARAVAAAGTSDTLVLANTGVPYREPIRLRGLGGTPAHPFVIEGNGAVITGLKPLLAEHWESREDGLFFYPVAKKPYGNPLLVSRGSRLPQAESAEAIEPGQFLWDKAGILFRPEAGKAIADYKLEATLIVSGLAVSGSSYITCRNLVSEYHSNDGFNVHGDCRGIVCENIVARHNGDDGFSVHETIGAVVRNAHFHHNRWGIQDVNASRSVFNGVTSEHNEVNGADFVGGYHSLVDCVIRNNGRAQINVRGGSPGHLIGSEHNPLCKGVAYLGNVIAHGGTAGLFVSGGARVTAEHCVFARSTTGVAVRKDSVLHLTTSIVSGTERELDVMGGTCFRDHNLYHPGRFRWMGKTFGPEQWEAFRAASDGDAQSLLSNPKLDDTLHPAPGSPAAAHRPPIGPTAPVLWYVAQDGQPPGSTRSGGAEIGVD